MATRRQNRNRKSRKHRRRGGDPITQGIRFLAPKMAHEYIGPSTSSLAKQIFPMIEAYKGPIRQGYKIVGQINPARQKEFVKLLEDNPNVNKENLIRDLIHKEGMDKSMEEDMRVSINAILPDSDRWPGR